MNISLLAPGPKFVAKLGLAPVEKVKQMMGNDAMNFPFILISKEFKLKLLPAERRDALFGLGFVPYFIYTGGQDKVELPDFKLVRVAIKTLFNNACKFKEHKMFSTWKTGVNLASGSSRTPSMSGPRLPRLAPRSSRMKVNNHSAHFNHPIKVLNFLRLI